MGEPVRLSKFLQWRGIASRREAERILEAGRVSVNGQVVKEPGSKADPEEDEIRLDGNPVPKAPPRVYYLMYKPKGCITTRNDPEGRKSVFHLLHRIKVRVEAAGRLDFTAEGALLLTNDGELVHKLTHPSTEVSKRYLAKVYRTPDDRDLKLIRNGRVFLEDGPIKPAKCRIHDTSEGGNVWVEIMVTENRNRLIRRIFEQLKHPVSKLRRESYATLSVRDMERGDVRPLTSDEIKRVKAIADGRKPKGGRPKKGKGFAKAKPKKKRHGHHKKK
jgi:23S rRNA pseudouridine2605 synthase